MYPQRALHEPAARLSALPYVREPLSQLRSQSRVGQDHAVFGISLADGGLPVGRSGDQLGARQARAEIGQ